MTSSKLTKKIKYTTLSKAIKNWQEDPTGEKKKIFFEKAYGIKNPEKIFEKSDFNKYFEMKKKGRLVFMISSQILVPTFYFMTNIFMAEKLSKKNIPVGIIIADYANDIFQSINSDKKNAFGTIKFAIGEKNSENILSNRISVSPYGIKEKTGHIKKIQTIQEANGYKCSSILIKISRAIDENNNSLKYKKRGQEMIAIEAILGYSYQKYKNSENEIIIPLDKFYKLMYKTAIKTLRQNKIIPNQKTMPIYFVNLEKIIKTLSKYGHCSKKANKILQISLFKNSNNLKINKRGFLCNAKSNLMDPNSFYGFYMSIPDVFFECLSCCNEYFTKKIIRNQKLQDVYGVKKTVIHIPDQEISELNNYFLHPTGKYISDIKKIINNFIYKKKLLNSPQKNNISDMHKKFSNNYLKKICQNPKKLPQNKIFIPKKILDCYSHLLQN